MISPTTDPSSVTVAKWLRVSRMMRSASHTGTCASRASAGRIDCSTNPVSQARSSRLCRCTTPSRSSALSLTTG
nr:hypothetical protein [Rhodococcus rhodochrous]